MPPRRGPAAGSGRPTSRPGPRSARGGWLRVVCARPACGRPSVQPKETCTSAARGLFRRLVTRSPSCLSKLSGVPILAIPLRYGVFLDQELRRAQRPRVLDQVAHLLAVDRIEANVEPVEAHVGFAGERELVRLGLDLSGAPLLWKAEAHRRPVLGEGEKDDLPDAELDPPAHERLTRPRKRPRKFLHLGDGHRHRPGTVRPPRADLPRTPWSDPGCNESVTLDPQSPHRGNRRARDPNPSLPLSQRSRLSGRRPNAPRDWRSQPRARTIRAAARRPNLARRPGSARRTRRTSVVSRVPRLTTDSRRAGSAARAASDRHWT